MLALASEEDPLWFKIPIPRSGVYKLTYTDLKNQGIRIKDFNPNALQFYSTTGIQLSQTNSKEIPSGMTRIPRIYNGPSNKINNKSFYLFYAEGSFRDSTKTSFHSYDSNNYVFVKIDNSTTELVEFKSQPIERQNTHIKTSLRVSERFEQERYNLVNSGREWFGDLITSEYFQNISFTGLASEKPVELNFRFISSSSVLNSMQLFVENEPLGSVSLPISFYNKNDSYGRYYRVGNEAVGKFEIKPNSRSIKLRLELEKSERSGDGAYLDWYTVTYQRNNGFYETQYEATSIEENPIAVKNILISDLVGKGNIWDVTNPLSPEVLLSDKPIFTQSSHQSKLLFFTNENAFSVPDLTKINFEKPDLTFTPDLLLISPSSFLNAAEKLAQYRRTQDSLDAQVVPIEQIYNWYSGGKTDPTAIRNFVREKWLQDTSKLKYLLLFGDANYDFKNNHRLDYIKPNEFVPAYESRESLEPIYSFSSDDYYGFLKEGLGFWPEGESINNSFKQNYDTTHQLSIGIGRLPVRNLVEAYNVVDKIIAYETDKKTLGPWRNKITFVADDGDFNRHLQDAEDFVAQLKNQNSTFQTSKLYLDAFPQTKSSLGFTSEKATDQLNKTIEQGTLIVNFNGHGSENGWTDEKLLTLDQLFRWKNKHTLPIFFTATCEYGRYDDPSKVSGAEISLLNKDNGAIALMTTTRPVFSSTNFKINTAFYEELDKYSNKRLGDLIKNTKNKSISGVLNRNFTLLGDPSTKILKPQKGIIIESVNDQRENIEIYNGQKVSFEGFIEKENLNGKIYGQFYDHATINRTLGDASSQVNFESSSNVIFEGVTSISNGKFKFDFLVPINTNTNEGNGIAYFYAVNADSTRDFIGSFSDYTISTDSLIEFTDNKGPVIELTSNNPPYLAFSVSDKSGINLSSSDTPFAILLKINDTLNIELKNYYKAIDGFENGKIDFPLPILPPGQHTLVLKIRDIYNNETIESFSLVVSRESLEIEKQIAYPNPTSDVVNFGIEHNQQGEDLEVTINIFNQKGQLLSSDQQQCYICDPNVSIGMNLDSNILLNGTYYYQILITNLNSKDINKASGTIIFWK